MQGWVSSTFFTMADPALRESTHRMAGGQCSIRGYWAQCSMSSGFFQNALGMITPTDRPSRRRALSDATTDASEAVSMHSKCDDGMSSRTTGRMPTLSCWEVSRTGEDAVNIGHSGANHGLESCQHSARGETWHPINALST
jgi:hypothetical protein